MQAESRSPVNEVLERLSGVSASGSGWAAYCPAHEDTKRKSLTVSEAEDGRVLAHCHKGCAFTDVMRAIGLEQRAAFPAPVRKGGKREYHVRDHTGRVAAIHHRQDEGDGKKRVWWTTPEGKSGLGGLKGDSLPLWGAESISGVDPDEIVVMCEGEKAAFALTYRGIPAVGTVTGASGTPSGESLEVLRGRRVILWPDADEEGKKHMHRVGKQLAEIAAEVRWYEWGDAPEKGDAADHPAIRRGKEEVAAVKEELAAAPTFLPPHDPAADGAATFAYAEPPYAEIRRLRRLHGGVSGIRTGLPKVDRNVHGLNKGYSYIVAARPNVGKSTLVGQTALTAAMQSYRVLLQSPEMSAVQYLDRFACYVAGVDYFRAQDGRTTDDEENRLSSAASLVSRLPLLIDDYGGQTVSRIRDNISRHEPELLVVDYLQYLMPDDPRANRNQQVGQVSRDIARIKSDYELPVLVAAQLNRASENRGNPEPVLSDLRDSGELEQDADVVMMVHRPDMYNSEVEAMDEDIVIFCRKNRMGQLWEARYGFLAGQQWLTDGSTPDASEEL